jgi:hypothetical protein
MNPGHDPRERRRNRGDDRRNDDGDYNRRRFDDSEHKRRRNDASFDVDMYDDNDSSTKRPRVRNRSASPGRHGGYSRLRSSSPLRKNAGKELFSRPSNKATKELFPAVINTGKELFPTGTSHGKDLLTNSATTFPSPGASLSTHIDYPSQPTSMANKRSSMGGHKRSGAVDNSSRSLADRITGGSGGGNGSGNVDNSSRSLADRITGRSNSDLRIRGAAERAGEFNIKGAASGTSVKELFPLKAGGGGSNNLNAGKELFGEKIKGRGGPRRKAEDMFG